MKSPLITRALRLLAWLNVGGALVAMWVDNVEAFGFFAVSGALAVATLCGVHAYRQAVEE